MPKTHPSGTYSGKDYLSSERLSMELVAKIRSFWAKLGKSPKVWIDREKFTNSYGRPDYRYVVRSNLTLHV